MGNSAKDCAVAKEVAGQHWNSVMGNPFQAVAPRPATQPIYTPSTGVICETNSRSSSASSLFPGPSQTVADFTAIR